MFRLACTVSLFVTVVSGTVVAQKCTEQLIKDAGEKGVPAEQKTSDVYFFAPFTEKPLIGPQAWKTAREQRGEARNVKDQWARVDKVVISSTGDMAYAYGTSHGIWDDAHGHHDNTTGFLDVWRVMEGSCKLAARMVQLEGAKP